MAAMEAVAFAGGPEIELVYGRRKGECETAVKCTKGKCDQKYALNFAPSLTNIDNSTHFNDAFQNLHTPDGAGFGPEEQTALMGAHSFGKLQVCAGGDEWDRKGTVL